jgi:CheY-like chemotaxis protein
MRKHILLIDDDQDDAELFIEALEEAGLDAVVAHFSDGNEAVNQLRGKAIPIPDIAFLDINMPQINGWDCLRELKLIAHLKKIPIVMYSTSNFDNQDLRPEDVGATAFLTKPDNFEELKIRLSTIISQFASA